MAKDRRLPAVDALRAVAALMVVLYHSAIGIHAESWPLQLVRPIASIGHTGVGLFLVISGFSIHLRWARATPEERAGFSVADFWKRRAVRLYPPYWIAAVLGTALLALRFGTSYIDHAYAIRELAGWHPNVIVAVLNQALVIVTNVIPAPVLAVVWTLALEEQIYLLYSLFMAKARQVRPLLLLVGSAVLSVVWRLGSSILTLSLPVGRTAAPGVDFTETNRVLYQQVPARLFEWVLGLVLAEAYVGHLRLPSITRRLPVAAVAIVVGAELVRRPMLYMTVRHGFYLSDIVVDQVFGVAYFLLLASLIALTPRLLDSPARPVLAGAAALGLASYSIYLTHPVLLQAANPWVAKAGMSRAVEWVAVWVATVAIAYGFYWLFERPFVARSKRVGQKVTSEIAPPA